MLKAGYLIEKLLKRHGFFPVDAAAFRQRLKARTNAYIHFIKCGFERGFERHGFKLTLPPSDKG
jgi:hypothetical protein